MTTSTKRKLCEFLTVVEKSMHELNTLLNDSLSSNNPCCCCCSTFIEYLKCNLTHCNKKKNLFPTIEPHTKN